MSLLEDLIKKYCSDGVEWKELGNIGRVAMCKRVMKSETAKEGDIPFYKIGTFGKKADAFISRALFEEYKNKYSFPKKGDILISASGTIGRTVIYDGEPAYYQDSNIVWLEHDENIILNKYLFYCYQLKPWNITSGGTIQRLYNDNIKNAKIQIPPIEVQKEIVRILDEFILKIAELQELLHKEYISRKKQYEYYRDKLLTFGDDVEYKTVGDVGLVTKLAGFEFTKYVTYSNEGKIIALRGLNVKNGKLNLNEVKYIDESDLTKLTRSKLYIDDMLFTYVGTIGEVALIDKNDKYYLAPNVALIRFDKKLILPNFMKYYFQSNIFFNTQINKLLQSSSMKNIPMEKIRKFLVPVPPLEDQERIVKILDSFDALCNDISSGLPAEIEMRKKQYEYYRDKLLTFKEKKIKE